MVTNTSRAQETSTWLRFQKLAEEARTRNSGFVHVQNKTANAATTAFPGLPVASSRGTDKIAMFSGAPEVRKKILGGQFDAYA
jgi:hypothetical protein